MVKYNYVENDLANESRSSRKTQSKHGKKGRVKLKKSKGKGKAKAVTPPTSEEEPDDEDDQGLLTDDEDISAPGRSSQSGRPEAVAPQVSDDELGSDDDLMTGTPTHGIQAPRAVKPTSSRGKGKARAVALPTSEEEPVGEVHQELLTDDEDRLSRGTGRHAAVTLQTSEEELDNTDGGESLIHDGGKSRLGMAVAQGSQGRQVKKASQSGKVAAATLQPSEDELASDDDLKAGIRREESTAPKAGNGEELDDEFTHKSEEALGKEKKTHSKAQRLARAKQQPKKRPIAVRNSSDSANGRNGKPRQTKQRNEDVKVQRQDNKAAEKTITGTPMQPAKSVQDVQDLSGVRRNRTPSLKRKLMEDTDALAPTASPKKRAKKSRAAQQDRMASVPATTAASTSGRPKPRLRKVKNVTPTTFGEERKQCEPSIYLHRVFAKWMGIGPIG